MISLGASLSMKFLGRCISSGTPFLIWLNKVGASVKEANVANSLGCGSGRQRRSNSLRPHMFIDTDWVGPHQISKVRFKRCMILPRHLVYSGLVSKNGMVRPPYSNSALSLKALRRSVCTSAKFRGSSTVLRSTGARRPYTPIRGAFVAEGGMTLAPPIERSDVIKKITEICILFMSYDVSLLMLRWQCGYSDELKFRDCELLLLVCWMMMKRLAEAVLIEM